MKVWVGYGSEHSSNLVIIGKFSTPKKAEDALQLLNEASHIAQSDADAGRLKAGSVLNEFTEAQMDLFRRTNLSLNHGDPEQLLYEFHTKQDGDKLVITTEEYDVNVFVKLLLHGEAKIEVYSAHDYGGPYGRQTHHG